MVDAADLISATFAGVWVRVPLPAPTFQTPNQPRRNLSRPFVQPITSDLASLTDFVATEEKMAKETTHRDPEVRAARIERRAKKRADTVMRKQIMKARKNSALEEV